jgi:hypothetical protein
VEIREYSAAERDAPSSAALFLVPVAAARVDVKLIVAIMMGAIMMTSCGQPLFVRLLSICY